MNERIRQITGQVLDELVPETWVALGYDKIKDIQNRTAELIIKECAKVGGDFEYARLHDSLVEDHILKHFGVEE